MIHETQSAQISQKQDGHNIYVQSWKQCTLPVITTIYLWQLMHLDTWCTWCASCPQVDELPQSHCGGNQEGTLFSRLNIYIYIYSIWYKLVHFSLLLNPAIQTMGNTLNILHPGRMEQDESHPHFVFHCKLPKVNNIRLN